MVRIDSFSPREAEINMRSTTLRIIWVCCSPLSTVSPDFRFSTDKPTGQTQWSILHDLSPLPSQCCKLTPKKCFFFPHLVNSVQVAGEITDRMPRPRLVGLGVEMQHGSHMHKQHSDGKSPASSVERDTLKRQQRSADRMGVAISP